MASTILYKFRSGTTFEALPLPGSAARLFDVKKAIVKAKKLDSGAMEFDLAVRNSDTNEEYANESMILPRGTRLIVQRLPAQRGHGFLARMARNEHSGGATSMQNQNAVTPGTAPSGFYTIDSRAGDDDEFVQTGGGDDGEKELAALQAVTAMRSGGPAISGGYTGGARGGPAQGGAGRQGGPPGGFQKQNFRPNADPELREQEKKLMPKKRATGIPRTFLNLSAPPQTDGNKEGGENESSVPLLQPNTQGFEELKNRAGGQSASTAGTRRDLDYALKLTATTIPEHLQCGICESVVKNAMLLPWDPEGRTACESCIRDALTQNAFRCPLTGMEGVSPDDLHPNVGLRKAAELFIKGVMEKIDEIEQQQVEEAEVSAVGAQKSAERNILDGDGVEKGVIVSKKMSTLRNKSEEDDPFGGGDDEFGGDVFAVETEDKAEEEEPAEEESTKEAEKIDNAPGPVAEPEKTAETKPTENGANTSVGHHQDSQPIRNAPAYGDAKEPMPAPESRYNDNGDADKYDQKHAEHSNNRRDHRRRGPPVGYAMGPAGGAVSGSSGQNSQEEGDQSDRRYHGGRGGGGGGGGRGRGNSYSRDRGGYNDYEDRGSHRGRGGRGRGRYGRGGYNDSGDSSSRGHDDDNGRGTKRGWDDSSSGSYDQQQSSKSSRHDYYEDRHGGDRNHRHDRHDGNRSHHRNGHRGGRGGRSWGGRGGGYGGRGYGGRGRY